MPLRRFAPPLLLLAGGLSLALQGIGVAPPRHELTLAPGERKTLEVKVFTTEVTELQVFARPLDWTMKPDGTVVEVPPGANPYSALGWLRANLDPFAIQRDRYRPVKLTVEVPSGGGHAGSYWAALQFVTRAPNPDPRSAVLIQVAANYIVYVTIAGTERPGARIVRFAREGEGLVLDVENTGNTYLRLRGALRFLDPRGEELLTQEVPEHVLLREGLRRIRLVLPEALPREAVVAAVELWAEKPVPLPARLYAELPLR